ncbi:MAG: anthranilate phosphoribosyltransferase [Gammaproteobacteria bacterium]|nr:anthranilate phosphoribosyltransferase [Gammaproteobacteria bacterium]
MDITTALPQLLLQKDLAESDMQQVMTQIMTGKATPAQIGGFLVALRIKGESVAEITGAARVMRELATPVKVDCDYLVDTCGTGGDGANTFNISTAVSFVTAAAGAHVAKHGNRSITSSCGSADVLEAAGANLDIAPELVGRAITEVGVGFMFAVKHHGAMKHAIGPRKELGLRTIFNVLGPLTNPAGAPNQVIGVFDRQLVPTIAAVLQSLGSNHVLVVHSADGMDEISIADKTNVAELKDGQISEYVIQPEDYGLSKSPLEPLRVTNVDDAVAMLKLAISGKGEGASDIVALNAGAAIYASGLAGSLKEGVVLAEDAMGSGAASAKFEEFISFTQHCC